MVILITGISSGFGMETARLLSQEGHIVYGTVRRNVEPLPGVHYLKVDVRHREAVQNAVQQMVKQEGRIDVLINNAGMGIGGPVEFATDGGVMGLPFQGFYSASKFAIEGYCEALRLEVQQFGIQVVVMRPGDFSTGFTASRKKTVNADAMQVYRSYAKSMGKVEHDETGGLKPQVLARKISQIIRKKNPRHGYVVASLEQRLSVFLKRVLPARWFAKILGNYYKL